MQSLGCSFHRADKNVVEDILRCCHIVRNLDRTNISNDLAGKYLKTWLWSFYMPAFQNAHTALQNKNLRQICANFIRTHQVRRHLFLKSLYHSYFE